MCEAFCWVGEINPLGPQQILEFHVFRCLPISRMKMAQFEPDPLKPKTTSKCALWIREKKLKNGTNPIPCKFFSSPKDA